MGKEVRVFLVEDHPIVRDGLVQLLSREEDLTICGEAENAFEALEAMSTAKPDLLIVDISLRASSGLELIKDVKARFPEVLVLVLSMHDESLYAERALAAGAKGYVMKEEATETLLAAIRRVLGGGVWVSERMAGRLLHKVADTGTPTALGPLERLTDRELQVFEMIGRGMITRQIAADLDLSVKTVESYRANIKQKLGLKGSVELVRHAIQWVENR